MNNGITTSIISFLCIIHLVQSQTWKRILKINKNTGIPGNIQPDQWYNEKNVATYTTVTAEDNYLATATGQSLTVENTNFKSLLIKDWVDNLITVDRVQLRICKDNTIQKQVLFDASSSSFNSWLSVPNIISSSWTDLTSSTPYQDKWVGINPSQWNKRSFTIWNYASSCPVDRAFFLITTWVGLCDLEWGEGYSVPGIFYSNVDTLGVNELDQVGVEADTFIIEIRYKAPTTNPTFIPTINPTLDPTMEPTMYPTIDPTYAPTQKPTTECANDEDAILKISFDYVLQDDGTPTDIVMDTLSNAAGIFIETDIDESTNCDVTDYSLSITLDNHLRNANINASICFQCVHDEELNVDFVEQDLQEKFIQTVDDTTNVLTVSNVNDIEVEVVDERIVDDIIITTTIKINNNGINNKNNKKSVLNHPLFIPVLAGIIGLLIVMFVICVFMLYYRRKKRREMERQKNKINQTGTQNMELAKVVSLSEYQTDEIDIDRASIDNEMVNTPLGDNGELHLWLNGIHLLMHYEIFINNGYGENISKLQKINDVKLVSMGINKMAHRKAILLQIAQDKLTQINTDDVNKLMGEGLDGTDSDDNDCDNELYKPNEDLNEIHETPNAITPMGQTSNGMNGNATNIGIDEENENDKLYHSTKNNSTQQ